MLTGNKNIDLIILNKLHDKDLTNIYLVNKNLYNLSNDQSFWLNRIMIKFPYLDLDLLRRCKGDKNWCQYYTKDLVLLNTYTNNLSLNLGSTQGRMDYIKISLDKGAYINKYSSMAVRVASENNHLDIVKYLHKNGAHIHVHNDLICRNASEDGNLEIVKYLVENGADFRSDNDYSVRRAYFNGYHDVVSYLVKMGAPDPFGI